MMKIISHSSCVIIESSETGELLANLYDSSYPIEFFRSRLNLIGGNYKKEDKSPQEILLREINEELSLNQKYINNKEKSLKIIKGEWKPPRRIKSFASDRDISLIKKEIISKIIPYKDYLWSFPSFNDKNLFDSLSSVFISKIKQDVFELVRKNIDKGKSIKNEGLAVICNIKDLIKGKYLCAWAAGCILSDYKNIDIPNSYGIRIECIGKPRSSYRDYIGEFEYMTPVFIDF